MPPPAPPAQADIRRTLETFARYDTYGRGFLSLGELGEFISDMQYDADESYLRELCSTFGTSGGHANAPCVPLEEFGVLCDSLGGLERLQSARGAGAGEVRAEVAAAAVQVLGEETWEVFRRYDTNGTGKLSHREIVELLADMQYDADAGYLRQLLDTFEGQKTLLQGTLQTFAVVLGEPFAAVANLGCRPTFAGNSPSLEVHLLDFDSDLYGRELEITFRQMLRDERKFSGPDELREQIGRDVAAARACLLA